MQIAAIADAVLKQIPIELHRKVAQGLCSESKVIIRHKGLKIEFYRVGDIRVMIKAENPKNPLRCHWVLSEETLISQLPDTLVQDYQERDNLTIDQIVDLEGLPALPVLNIKVEGDGSGYTCIEFKKGFLRTYRNVQELNEREFTERDKERFREQESR